MTTYMNIKTLYVYCIMISFCGAYAMEPDIEKGLVFAHNDALNPYHLIKECDEMEWSELWQLRALIDDYGKNSVHYRDKNLRMSLFEDPYGPFDAAARLEKRIEAIKAADWSGMMRHAAFVSVNVGAAGLLLYNHVIYNLHTDNLPTLFRVGIANACVGYTYELVCALRYAIHFSHMDSVHTALTYNREKFAYDNGLSIL